MRRYVFVEGPGDIDAAHNLLTRLSLRCGDYTPWAKPLRWPNLHQWQNANRGGVEAACNFARAKGDAASILVLRDEDDLCPATTGPAITAQIRTLALPLPVGYVLLKPEFEVLFLPCIGQMAGRLLDGDRPGIAAGTVWDGMTWECRRGIKEWLSLQYPPGRQYKPTVDQLSLTRMIDLDALSVSDVPSFGTLERTVRFLIHTQPPDLVYP